MCLIHQNQNPGVNSLMKMGFGGMMESSHLIPFDSIDNRIIDGKLSDINSEQGSCLRTFGLKPALLAM